MHTVLAVGPYIYVRMASAPQRPDGLNREALEGQIISISSEVLNTPVGMILRDAQTSGRPAVFKDAFDNVTPIADFEVEFGMVHVNNVIGVRTA